MTDIPPSRFRVEERGRRLVVIDTRTGAPATSIAALPPADGTKARQLSRRPRSGGGELTTLAVYDDKGPRTIRLDAGGAATIGRTKLIAIVALFAFVVLVVFEPWALALPFFLLQPAIRTPARGAITRWLDRLAKPT